jgi:hypothetical protein
MEIAMRNRDGGKQVADNGGHFEGWCMGVELQNVRRFGDGSIDYDFYERRARQLRAQCLAEMLASAWRSLLILVKLARTRARQADAGGRRLAAQARR